MWYQRRGRVIIPARTRFRAWRARNVIASLMLLALCGWGQLRSSERWAIQGVGGGAAAATELRAGVIEDLIHWFGDILNPDGATPPPPPPPPPPPDSDNEW